MEVSPVPFVRSWRCCVSTETIFACRGYLLETGSCDSCEKAGDTTAINTTMGNKHFTFFSMFAHRLPAECRDTLLLTFEYRKRLLRANRICHKILRPLNTITGDPTARKAESGRR